MFLKWYGQSFFQIGIKNSKKENVILAIDPFDKSLGLKVPKFEADILLISHSHYDHSNKSAIKGEPFLIEEPGEYEIKEVFIKGILGFHDSVEGKERGTLTIFKIVGENMSLCHLSDIGQKSLSEEQIEQLGEIDILLIPVGGVYTIGAKEAAEIIYQIEPKIVIPMHYKIDNLKLNLEKVDKFLKIMGVEERNFQQKLKITPQDLPQEETKIILLEV